MSRALVIAVIFCAAIGRSSAGDNLVSPSGFDSVPGEANNVIPFTWNTARYQQIYGASSLGALSGQAITGIAFRVDERDGFDGDYAGGFTYSSLEIRLSITPRGVDQLSTNLDANPGPNPIVVYNRPYTIPPLEGDLAVNPFDLRIRIETPFTYNGGNLLVDILTPNVDTPLPHLDAVNRFDAVNRTYIDSVGNPRAGQDTLGLITQFEYVPEPTTVALAAFSLLVVGLRRCRSRWSPKCVVETRGRNRGPA